MKIITNIDTSHDEEIIIYTHERTKLIEDIEKLVLENSVDLIGYNNKTATVLELSDIYCFFVENYKIYAKTADSNFLIKSRLYQLEENLPENFIKINQSCIANIKLIKKFDASLSGTLMVIFKNQYVDYVSRRNVKKIKERLGL